MIKVLGRPTSSNVQKVLWCVGELGIDFVHEPEYGGPYGKVKEPEYLALNPNGLVPTLIHDDFVLWESHAIVRYLASAFGMGSLCPSDPKARASAERWMDWSQSTLDAVTFPPFYELIRKSAADRDQKVIDQAVRDAAPKLAILDDVLAKTPFVGGEQLTFADIPFGPALHRWMNLPIERSATPNIDAWYQRMRERPAYAKWVAIPLA